MRGIRFIVVFAAMVSVCVGLGTADAQRVGHVTHLKNGMKVMLREDHSSALVAAYIVVGAGARYEDDRTNGMSHLLEHLLFDGTTTRTQQEIKETFDYYGGYANAFTREDYAAYLITMPSEYIEQGLEVQADMLLKSWFTGEQLEKERRVVIEEITKDSDNYRSWDADRFAALSYEGTPYSRPVIGNKENVESVGKWELYGYYKAHYVPSNMTAMVIGDIDPQRILAVLSRLYGDVEPGALGAPETAPLRYAQDRFEVMSTKAPHAYLRLAFAAPLLSDRDAAPFQVLTDLLLASPDTWIGGALTSGDRALASFADGSYDSYRNAATFALSIGIGDPRNAGACVKRLQDVSRAFAAKGPDEEQLRRTKLGIRADAVFSTQSFMYEGMDLCNWEGTATYERRAEYLRQIQDVTADEVRRVAEKWLVDAHCVAVTFVPEDGADRTRPSGEMPAGMGGHMGGHTLAWPSPIALDAVGEQTAKRTLDNGLTLIAKCSPQSEVTAVHVLVRHRIRCEPEGRNGIGYVAQLMLTGGTRNRSADRIALDIADIAARVKVVDDPGLPYDNYYNSKDYAYIRFEVLDEYREQGLDLLADLVTGARFPEDKLEDAKSRALIAARGLGKTAGGEAARVFSELFYAEGSPYRGSINGTQESVKAITREDVLAYYRRAYGPNNLIISIVSPMPVEEALDRLASLFGSMERTPAAEGTVPTVAKIAAPVERKVNVDADQAQIILGMALPGAADPDVPALTIMNEILANRLAQELREKQGLAYSVGSSVEFLEDFGMFTAGMGTRSENIETARQGILDVIRAFRDEDISDRELETYVNSYWGHLLRFRQSAINQAYYLGYYDHIGLGYDYDSRQFGILRSVTADDVRRVARKYLDLDRYVLVIAGRL
jgi:zinc protease